ncbi:hypothetical protein [Egbenema bharatensis]|uniref:hypothetical protein n=1 Tax=Egbenema bharatensis TaxID=3463334 RepID=UPI003A8B3B04
MVYSQYLDDCAATREQYLEAEARAEALEIEARSAGRGCGGMGMRCGLGSIGGVSGKDYLFP